MSNREERNRENRKSADPSRGEEKSAPGRSGRPDDKPSPRYGQDPKTGGGTTPGSGTERKKALDRQAGGDRDEE